MSKKVILSRRDMSEDTTRTRVGQEASEQGFTVEAELPQGSLVRINDAQCTNLSEQGYRAKVLPDTNILRIGSYEIDIEATKPEPEIPENLRVPAELISVWPHYLVQLAAPPIDDWIRQIEQLGIQVVEPVSPYGLYIIGAPNAMAALEQELSFVEWVGPFHPAYRIGEGVLRQDGPHRLDISVFPPEGFEQVRRRVGSLDGTIVRESLPPQEDRLGYASLIADFRRISDEDIASLARLPDVRWIETAGIEPGLEGERDVLVIAGDSTGNPGYQAWLTKHGFTGAGSVISFGDRGVDRNKINNISGHPDLRGRQVAFIDYTDNPDSKDRVGHGTLVASIAVGNAATGVHEAPAPNNFFLGQGVAPGAGFISQNIISANGGSPDLSVLARDAVSNGADILNISWNDKQQPGAGYTANARILDMRVRNPAGSSQDPRPLTIVASAGNQGSRPKRITPPKEAKNLIVVGASRRGATGDGALWPRSSRGPAVDGRILPTVVAPGVDVTGAASSCANSTPVFGSDQYAADSGTSFASPIVAGCCALLNEWWQSWNGGRIPSPAMLKALLINGADDLVVGADGETGTNAHIPNSHQGWGRVNLKNIFEMAPDVPDATRGPRIYFDQEHPFDGQSKAFSLCVSPFSQTRPLRVTLVWTDAPGAIGQNPALVNDLDLEVTNLATNVPYRGNQFQNGFSVPGANHDFDALNNVECIYIEQPSDTYEVRVIPSRLNRDARFPFSGPGWQDFALVIDNAETMACP